MFGKRTLGIHVRDEKNTSDSVPQVIPIPAKVTIPMSMHVGAPCTPVVKVGQEVKVGEPIGTPGGLGAPIHASVSGKVTAIQDLLMPNGSTVPAVVITSDGKQTVWEGGQAPRGPRSGLLHRGGEAERPGGSGRRRLPHLGQAHHRG